ncbi:Eco57I restriction-modification methylase domain-containing protein [Rodentibacter caecimuris]|uniref:Eco57I restriction-modification methylase domain-containing protein n=1 Tax=Rodentibacter caecimuris TaxID=1796644 RepID=UPI00224998D0|nr:Eco57I restriction-modification methylase domain-containing protein [Rodentibacter heylii]MCX2962309.1 Eco57I restriction-modification methylase domain-containing protein [Rodentibacter heylii]
MKFDVIVGNPPYQENDNGQREDGSANASASPLYHHFFYLAKHHSKQYTSLIFPARWLTGAGKGLGTFSQDLLNDKHFKSLSLYQNPKAVFPNNDIKGGVMHFVYDKTQEQKANIQVIEGEGKINKFKGYLNSGNTGIFIPFEELLHILEKVQTKEDLKSSNIQNIVSFRKPYGLSTDFLKNPSKYKLPPVFENANNPDDIEIFGLIDTNRTSRFVPKDYPIPTGHETINRWKVFAPYAYGCGSLGEVAATPMLGKPMLGKPMQISTETFLRIGNFSSQYEAESFVKYYKSKFFRVLVGILKVTQHSTTTYGFVPIQNFTEQSDIDWIKSIAEIDQQLYKKYGLNQKEIAFIEEKVKAME